MKSLHSLIALLAAAVLSGCATYVPSVPDKYVGPIAVVHDSTKVHGSTKADFFFVEAIDESKIMNSLRATLIANNGKGMSMTPVVLVRPVVAEKPLKLTIKARTHFAAPILAMVRTAYQVEGTVEFTPKENTTYVVKGELGDEYSAVWLEDKSTGQVVGSKIEPKGSAKLGFFEK
jgi:hypothetical protein